MSEPQVQQIGESPNVTQKQEEKNRPVFAPTEPPTEETAPDTTQDQATTNKGKAKRDTKAKGFFGFTFAIVFLGLLVFARAKTTRKRKKDNANK